MKLVRLAVCALLCGCAAPAISGEHARSGPPAYVDLQRAYARAGYADVVASYGRDAATLAQSERVAAFDGMGAQFDAAAQNVHETARDADSRVTSIRPQPVADVSAHDESIRSVSIDPSQYAQALAQRAERARALREQQMREREATTALDFERSHEQQRLQLRLRLTSNAYLDPSVRARLQAQLGALDAQERAAVAAQRRIDDREVASYASQLASQNQRELAQMEEEVAAHRAAVAQVPRPSSSVLPEAIRHPAYDASAIGAQFRDAANRVASRFADLHAADRSARTAADAEIRRIAETRVQLHAAALDAIRARAERVAAAQGLGSVYFSSPPPGARDITDDL